MTEWTGASDVNEDEEDELPHLEDDAVMVVAVAAASAERKETERRGDDEDDAIARTTPDRLLLLAMPIFRVFHTFCDQNNIRDRADRELAGKVSNTVEWRDGIGRISRFDDFQNGKVALLLLAQRRRQMDGHRRGRCAGIRRYFVVITNHRVENVHQRRYQIARRACKSTKKKEIKRGKISIQLIA